jgi:hypothetical protein
MYLHGLLAHQSQTAFPRMPQQAFLLRMLANSGIAASAKCVSGLIQAHENVMQSPQI